MRGKGFHIWTAFFTKINPYIVDNLSKGLEFLKYPIIRYANNINDEKNYFYEESNLKIFQFGKSNVLWHSLIE